MARDSPEPQNGVVATYPQYKASNNDEILFQLARVRTLSEYQKIVAYEWLPAILGDRFALPPYSGYRTDVHPQAMLEMSAVMRCVCGSDTLYKSADSVVAVLDIR